MMIPTLPWWVSGGGWSKGNFMGEWWDGWARRTCSSVMSSERLWPNIYLCVCLCVCVPEASKLVMSYVAAVCGKGQEVNKVKEQLLQSNPVLEGEWAPFTLELHPNSGAGPSWGFTFGDWICVDSTVPFQRLFCQDLEDRKLKETAFCYLSPTVH